MGTDLVNFALVVFKKKAVLLRIPEMKASVGGFGISPCECEGGHAEMSGDSFPVSTGEKDVSVFASGKAALSASLAFKADAFFIEFFSFN
jgi:hypothetical protein